MPRHRAPWTIVAMLCAAAIVLAVVAVIERPAPLPRDGSIADAQVVDPVTDELSVHVHSPGRSLTAGQARGYLSMPWRFFQLTNGGKTVQAVVATGDASCVKPVGYRVVETDSYVELWFWSSKAPAGTRCVDLLTVYRTNIRLRAPLGTRELLHAPTAPAWPAGRVFGQTVKYSAG